MFSLTWIIAAILALQASAQTDEYDSPNGLSFYQGESGTITCNFAPRSEAEVVAISGFGLRHESLDSVVVISESCRVSRSPEQVDVYAATDSLLSDGVCQAAFGQMEMQQEAKLVIPVDLQETGQYKCSAWTSLEHMDHEPVIDVQELLVAPKNMRMIFSPEPVYAGYELTITCVSEGGMPVADFEYGIGGEVQDGEIAPFTPAKEDNGTEYYCKDKSHPNLDGGNSEATFKSKDLVVYYFSATKTDVTEITLNPQMTEMLSCSTDENLPIGTDKAYKWTKDGEELVGEDLVDLTISQKPDLNETIIEEYACTAKADDEKFEVASLVFNVTWDVETSTPAPTTTTTAKAIVKQTTAGKTDKKENKDVSEGSPTVIIVVVVVITVIVLIVVIAIIVIKKRNADSANVSKGADPGPTPQKNADPEQGNGETDVSESLLKDSEREKTTDDSGKP